MNLFKANQFDIEQQHAKNIMLSQNKYGKFEDVTDKTKISGYKNTFTSAFIDLNKDQYPDLVMSPDAAKLFIYRNNKDGSFTEMLNPGGNGFWMGIASGDYDNDLDEDLFLTNIGHQYSPPNKFIRGTLKKNKYLNVNHVLLQNDGKFKFVDRTKEANLIKRDFGWVQYLKILI